MLDLQEFTIYYYPNREVFETARAEKFTSTRLSFR